MGDLWRSQSMQLVQIFINIEAAHDTVDELGEEGLVQFKDLNPNVNAFQRNFVREVKRAEEMERRVRFFKSQIDLFNEISVEEGKAPIITSPTNKLESYDMNDMELKFEELEREMKQMISNQAILTRNRNELIELRYTLSNEDTFFSSNILADSTSSESKLHLVAPEQDYMLNLSMKGVKLGFIAGVINKEKFPVFEPILFRATRGNLYLNKVEIPEKLRDPVTGQEVEKTAYIVFFQGEQLEMKIRKVSESFGANIYACPDASSKRALLLRQVEERLKDLNVVLSRSLDHQSEILADIGIHINAWLSKVRKEKAIYHTLNMFNYDVGRKCLIAEGWVSSRSLDAVNLALRRARDRSGAMVPSILTPIPTHEEPPTYFINNRLTIGFQNIIDAYGVPRYREINPTVFAIVTFPFLFGMMFGDVGHGIILMCMALFMIYKEGEWTEENVSDLIKSPFSGRYVILLMSLFAIYCGFIYNEFFSVPMAILPSNWQVVPDSTTFVPISLSRAYEFGVDWAWKGAANELVFYNSLKMKMSIIIGVIHMTLGLVLKGVNALFFRKRLDLFFECIPQLVLLLSLFGYLCALIFIKWSYPFYENDVTGASLKDNIGGVADAPLLLTMMIYMFLPPGSQPPAQNPAHMGPYWSLYPGQATVQLVLVILAALSIPTMLLVKPLLLCYQNRQSYSAVGRDLDNELDGIDASAFQPKTFDFGDEMIHQVIETIEFTLSTVSNTASYLRLWALSLAHSELSTVFWNLGLVDLGMRTLPFFGTFVVWAIFCGLSVGVLLILETLSAFLHTMRLHWVEFQNKFYKGDGYSFVPFSYSHMQLTIDQNNQLHAM